MWFSSTSGYACNDADKPTPKFKVGDRAGSIYDDGGCWTINNVYLNGSRYFYSLEEYPSYGYACDEYDKHWKKLPKFKVGDRIVRMRGDHCQEKIEITGYDLGTNVYWCTGGCMWEITETDSNYELDTSEELIQPSFGEILLTTDDPETIRKAYAIMGVGTKKVPFWKKTKMTESNLCDISVLLPPKPFQTSLSSSRPFQ